MKKMNFLKIVFTLVVAISISGVFAQSTDVPGVVGDYATTGAVTVMEGTTIPLYALPDPYFHPSYDADVAGTLTAGYTWNWTESVTSDLAFSNDAVADNYTAVSGMLVANSPYTITVQETAPAAMGSCSDAGTTIAMTVVAAPSFAINGGDATYDLCAGDIGLPSDMQTTIAGGSEAYHLAWSLEIATLNAASAKEFYYSDEAGAGQNGVQFYAVENVQTTGNFDGSQNAATATYDIMTVATFPVINNATIDAVTVYTYTLASINDRASRFGDFIGLDGDDTDDSAYTDIVATAAGDQVIVTVYPAPITGPIYHINGAWAN